MPIIPDINLMGISNMFGAFGWFIIIELDFRQLFIYYLVKLL